MSLKNQTTTKGLKGWERNEQKNQKLDIKMNKKTKSLKS
jgi:hypothetical protein